MRIKLKIAAESAHFPYTPKGFNKLAQGQRSATLGEGDQ
jgi:hypothetical protein